MSLETIDGCDYCNECHYSTAVHRCNEGTCHKPKQAASLEHAVAERERREPGHSVSRSATLKQQSHPIQRGEETGTTVIAGYAFPAFPGHGAAVRAIAERLLASHEKRLDDFCHAAASGEYGAGQIDYVLTDLVTEAVREAFAAGRTLGRDEGARELATMTAMWRGLVDNAKLLHAEIKELRMKRSQVPK